MVLNCKLTDISIPVCFGYCKCTQGQALEYGVKIAGCTVHFVDEGTDSGPIILQKPVPVLNDDTEESLAARILVEEHKAMPEALRLWALGKLEIQGRRVIVHP